MPTETKRRRWPKVLLLLGIIAVLLVAAAFVADQAARNRMLVTISKETTYITEPLRSDGYPDYVAALNQRFSKGVTPENNSAVLFLKAVGPKIISENIRAKYFEMLGIPPLPVEGDYFITSDDHVTAYLALHPGEEQGSGKPAEEGMMGAGPAGPAFVGNPPEEDPREKLNTQFDSAIQRPWSKEEYPAWAEWLAANEKPLILLVEATQRPRRYDPLICEEDTAAINILLEAVFHHRDVARAFCARAMLRLGEGKVEEAWQDLLACHRLARLAGQGHTYVEALVAVTIEFMACKGDRALLEHGKLSAGQIEKMRADLNKLSAMPSIADTIAGGERLILLDIITAFAQGRMNDSTTDDSLLSIPIHMIAWDYGLRLANSLMDQAADACRQPTQKARKMAFDKLDQKFEQLSSDTNNISKFLLSPRQSIAKKIVIMLVPAVSAPWTAQERSRMQFELTKLAFALAAYRAEHGAYPARLAELVPKYVKALPKDIFNNDADLHYSLRDKGYLLYSIGQNGIDDGGKGYDDRKANEGWDDLHVRIPAEP